MAGQHRAGLRAGNWPAGPHLVPQGPRLARRGRGLRCPLEPTAYPPAGSELLLVRLEAVSVTVAVCYRPPDDTALARLTETLEDLPGSSKLLLVGDINLPEVQWQQRAGRIFAKCLLNFGLRPDSQ